MKILAGVLVLFFLGSVPAWAVLGQYESSVSLDQKYMKSVDRVQSSQKYVVHQLTSENGTIVREYVSPKGMVFGVSWRGRFMPNLHQLLGSYITKIQTAKRTQTQIRHLRGVIVKTDDFVFVNSGSMRFRTGTAYVPSLVPTGVSAEVVR